MRTGVDPVAPPRAATAAPGGRGPTPPPARRRPAWPLAAAAAVLAVAAFGSLFVGVSALSPADLLDLDQHQTRVLVVSRIPRLVAILLAGTSMGVAGLIMQHLARNRFVAPSTAGTVECASLGVLVATMWFGSSSVGAKMGIAVAFALAGSAVFLQILRRLSYRDVLVVPLVGLMFGGVVRSATSFVAYRNDLLQTLEAWTNGDFSGVLRGRYELLHVAAVAAAAAYVFADRFTLAGLGRSFSVNLGLHYERVVTAGLVIVSVVTAVVVVTVGSLPFLGLIVPNLVTLALGDNLKRVLPVTALAGAGFVLACDVIGRTIRYPYEIPVGTVVGVVGSGVFLLLLLTGGRRG